MGVVADVVHKNGRCEYTSWSSPVVVVYCLALFSSKLHRNGTIGRHVRLFVSTAISVLVVVAVVAVVVSSSWLVPAVVTMFMSMVVCSSSLYRNRHHHRHCLRLRPLVRRHRRRFKAHVRLFGSLLLLTCILACARAAVFVNSINSFLLPPHMNAA